MLKTSSPANCDKVYTLSQLAKIIGAKVKGDTEQVITGLAPLATATNNQLTFLTNPAYTQYLATTQAGAVIVREPDSQGYDGNVLIAADPYLAYATLSALFAPDKPAAAIHPSAVVDNSASLGENVAIGANVVIEAGARVGRGCCIGAGSVIGRNCVIGEAALIHANVTLYHGVCVGDRAIFHSGVVIGSDGFGFAPDGQNRIKIHQLGGVVIGNDVEIGAGTCIDRGALDDTEIADGVKLDNLVHVAHNVKIGANTIMCGCSGVAGSTTIGANCIIAGAVGIINYLTICDGVTVTAGSLVTKSISEPGTYSSGTPLMANAEWRKNAATFPRLYNIYQNQKKLEKNRP